MIVLGVDPSLTGFGWCVHNSSVAGKERVLAKGVLTTTAKEVFVGRYIYLRLALTSIVGAYPEIEAMGVESPPFGESYSEGLYGLFIQVNEVAYTCRKNVVYFDPQRVKLMARIDSTVRRGTMDKQAMIDASRAETLIKRWNHNEADAYIIARSTARFWDFYYGRLEESELTPSERSIFYNKHTFIRGKHAGKTVEKGLLFKEGDRFFEFSKLAPQDVSPKHFTYVRT